MTKDGVIELVEAGLAKLVWPKDDRNDVLLTKQAAAKRLIEASVRTLFGREDPMVPLILASAAAGILRNLLNQQDPTAVQRLYKEVFERGLRAALGSEAGEVAVCGVDVRETLQMLNKKANFLKHADRDPDTAVEVSTRDATQKMMEAMVYYVRLALPMTKTMEAFGQWLNWHFRSNASQMLALPDGEHLHEKDLQVQLQFGALWLARQTTEEDSAS